MKTKSTAKRSAIPWWRRTGQSSLVERRRAPSCQSCLKMPRPCTKPAPRCHPERATCTTTWCVPYHMFSVRSVMHVFLLCVAIPAHTRVHIHHLHTHHVGPIHRVVDQWRWLVERQRVPIPYAQGNVKEMVLSEHIRSACMQLHRSDHCTCTHHTTAVAPIRPKRNNV